jgi:hypothetical protein
MMPFSIEQGVQAADKGLSLNEEPQKHPSGAKARIVIGTFKARLKPCPFKAAPQFEFFSKLRCETPCSVEQGVFDLKLGGD